VPYIGEVVMCEVTKTGVYVERYRWNRSTTLLIISGAVSAIVSVGVAMPLLPTILVGGGGILIVLWGLIHRRVALRADTAGITLGGSPLRYRATTTLIPWADIMNVILWEQVLPDGTLIPYVGLQRRPATIPPTEPAERRVQGEASGLLSDIPADVGTASRAVTGWQLDRSGLTRAIASFAPEVTVWDYDAGRLVTDE
jgi:hypothetical protein